MDNMKKKAKQNVLEDLRKKAKSMMGSKLGGLKKPESKDKEVPELKEVRNEEVTEVESASPGEDECEGMSVEEINEKIQALMVARDKMSK